jgi:hypothetical protein
METQDKICFCGVLVECLADIDSAVGSLVTEARLGKAQPLMVGADHIVASAAVWLH